MTKSLPFIISFLLLLLPQTLAAQTAPPPDASEFIDMSQHHSDHSITVSESSPIAEVPLVHNEDSIPQQLAPMPWQKGYGEPMQATEALGQPETLEKIAPPQPQQVQTELPEPEPEEAPPTNSVVLQGLNKVTGHISKLEGPIGIVLTFDNLEIITRRCWKSPADERPENAALLEIREIKAGEEPRRVFLGWMFSSSPGLSGLEHPVYDVNIVSCEFHENPEGTPQPKDEKPADEKPKAEKTKVEKPKTEKAKSPSAKPSAVKTNATSKTKREVAPKAVQ